jgi:nucleotide-binding universal stress UspA family protein
MKKLLVGSDGSPNAKAALDWATRVAEPFGAEVVAVTADGDLAETLTRRADADDADLVVVGLHGGGGSRHRHVDSVADALAHRATRPTAFVPEDAPAGVKHVVLGVDGSPGSADATKWCAAFASQLSAEVTATAVFTQHFEVLPEQDPKSIFQYFQRNVEGEWIAPLRAANLTVHPDFRREHHVDEALVGAAREAGADTIVVGMHGFAPVVHRRLGGVAMQLVHVTPLPLVLVPPGA